MTRVSEKKPHDGETVWYTGAGVQDDPSIAQDVCNSFFFSYQIRGDTIHTRSVIGSSPIGATN